MLTNFLLIVIGILCAYGLLRLIYIALSRARDSSDDFDYIRELKRSDCGEWQQYDVLLATHGYGWDTMKDWADYMVEADLKDVSEVTSGFNGELDVTESYLRNGSKCENTPELDEEMSSLSVAGYSRALNTLMKIGWFNQTCVLKFITPEKDETAIRKYIDTMVRRTFGAENAMKTDKKSGTGTNADSKSKSPESESSTKKQKSTVKLATSEDIISEKRNADQYIKESTISYKSYRISKEVYVNGSETRLIYYVPISIHSLAMEYSEFIIELGDSVGSDVWGNIIRCDMQSVQIFKVDSRHGEQFYDKLIAHAWDHACEWI